MSDLLIVKNLIVNIQRQAQIFFTKYRSVYHRKEPFLFIGNSNVKFMSRMQLCSGGLKVIWMPLQFHSSFFLMNFNESIESTEIRKNYASSQDGRHLVI